MHSEHTITDWLFDAIEKHLTTAPTKVGRGTIKKMEQPFWSQYRLRAGDYRVYYDVDEASRFVHVLRIYEKGRGETPTDLGHGTN